MAEFDLERWSTHRYRPVRPAWDAFQRGDLCLVVGAGVSMGSRLPSWDELIREAAISALSGTMGRRLDRAGRKLGMTTLALVSAIRAVAATERAFHANLTDALYRKAQEVKGNKVLMGVAAMLASKSHEQAGGALGLTYNFDDLLETALESSDKRVKAVALSSGDDLKKWSRQRAKSQVGIVHLHGYLPRAVVTDTNARNIKLVFSEQSYHEQASGRQTWAGLCQLHAFTRLTCLFVGFSFRDSNVRRLLQQGRELLSGDMPIHYAIRESYVLKAGSAATPLDRACDYLVAADLRSLGVEPVWVSDYRIEIPKLLASFRRIPNGAQ